MWYFKGHINYVVSCTWYHMYNRGWSVLNSQLFNLINRYFVAIGDKWTVISNV